MRANDAHQAPDDESDAAVLVRSRKALLGEGDVLGAAGPDPNAFAPGILLGFLQCPAPEPLEVPGFVPAQLLPERPAKKLSLSVHGAGRSTRAPAGTGHRGPEDGPA